MSMRQGMTELLERTSRLDGEMADMKAAFEEHQEAFNAHAQVRYSMVNFT